MVELQGLKRLRGLRGLSKLKGLGPDEPLPPPYNPKDPKFGQEGLVPDALAQITRDLEGDTQLAKQVFALKKDYPNGSIPELAIMALLRRNAINYHYQVWLLGGRRLKNGAVVDFIIDVGTDLSAWRIQGNYWHNRASRERIDTAQKYILLGQQVFGKRIARVVDLWDTKIMRRSSRQRVFDAALAGQELGP